MFLYLNDKSIIVTGGRANIDRADILTLAESVFRSKTSAGSS
jgi:hypothetical protein